MGQQATLTQSVQKGVFSQEFVQPVSPSRSSSNTGRLRKGRQRPGRLHLNEIQYATKTQNQQTHTGT